MASRLISAESGRGGFSPFVDVAISAMAAMFTFLAIYVAVVPPRPVPPLEILTKELPKAAWNRPFEAAIAVTGGQPPYEFKISTQQLKELNNLKLQFDDQSGWISGTPGAATRRELEMPRMLELEVNVVDRSQRYDETKLQLEITPVAVPFDPEKDRLRFATEEFRLPDAWIGRDYDSAIAILGGIEPYEVVMRDLPPELSSSLGRISGIPDESAVPAGELSAEYRVPVEVVDQQSAKLKHTMRTPRLVREFKLRVHRIQTIEVKGPFPTAGRAGLPFDAAVVAQGGQGKCTWTEPAGLLENEPDGAFRLLSSLGLTMDTRTGIIHGKLRRDLTSESQPLLITIPLLVDDQDPATDPIRTHITLSIFPPMRFVKPD